MCIAPVQTFQPLRLSFSSYDPRNPANLPMVVYVHDESDPFTVAMFASNTSVDWFLRQVSGGKKMRFCAS